MKNTTIPAMFDYQHPKVPEDCTHIISPSRISEFFDYPRIWYEENMLDQETFKGSTATVIGTICHYVYESVTKGEKPTREAIESDLRAYLEAVPNPDVDLQEVLSIYPLLVNEVVNQYVLPSNTKTQLLKTELPLYTKIIDGIYVSGTCDRIEGDCVVDFKNVSTKPNSERIPFNYKIQLLAYAYMLRNNGYKINRIRLVYGIRPTKTLGARCLVVTESITFNDEKMIRDTLYLIAETIKHVVEHPEHAYLLFKSYALKEKS